MRLFVKFCDIVHECLPKNVPQKYVKWNSRHTRYHKNIILLSRCITLLLKNRLSMCNDNVCSLNALKSKLKAKMKEAKNYSFCKALVAFMIKNASMF